MINCSEVQIKEHTAKIFGDSGGYWWELHGYFNSDYAAKGLWAWRNVSNHRFETASEAAVAVKEYAAYYGINYTGPILSGHIG